MRCGYDDREGSRYRGEDRRYDDGTLLWQRDWTLSRKTCIEQAEQMHGAVQNAHMMALRGCIRNQALVAIRMFLKSSRENECIT